MVNTDRLCMGCMNDNGGEKICPVCGYNSADRNPESCLPVKFIINNRFIVGKALRANGEGITYIGWDNGEDAVVTIKEYFPKGVAIRNPDKTVSMSPAGKYTFNEGLIEFMEINRKIMRSDLPSLVPVISVFEENGTVYCVSSSIPGITLGDFLNRNGGTLKWEQARALFLPLIDTLKGMNDLGIIHGAISDETIIVGRDGKLRISDYSISKLRSLKGGLESRIYPGFAAIEQYNYPEHQIGLYTDVYGLSATLLKVFLGNVPGDAPSRLQNNSLSIPGKFAEELPRHVLSALANGLQVLPRNRTKNIEDFKNELVYGEIATPKAVVAPKKAVPNNNTNPDKNGKKKSKGGSAKYAIISSLCTAIIFVGIFVALYFTIIKPAEDEKSKNASSKPTASYIEPEIDEIGDVDSDVVNSANLYPVSDFLGKYYHEVADSKDADMFKIVIANKQYSDKYPAGTVCEQSVAGGEKVELATEIQLVISLGPKNIKLPNLTGYKKDDVLITLLKHGFLYDNIVVVDRYDQSVESETVLEQIPPAGQQITADEKVTIYVSYRDDEDEIPDQNAVTSPDLQ